MHGRIKVSEAAVNRRAAWTVAAGSNPAPAIGRQGVQAGLTERVAEGIVWATEVYRLVGVVAPRAEGAHLAGLQVVGAKAARKRAARVAPPAWVALVAVAPAAGAAEGGGNHS